MCIKSLTSCKVVQHQCPCLWETHYVPTDDKGTVNLIIGQGIADTGTFLPDL